MHPIGFFRSQQTWWYKLFVGQGQLSGHGHGFAEYQALEQALTTHSLGQKAERNRKPFRRPKHSLPPRDCVDREMTKDLYLEPSVMKQLG
jgi:hypothetical protein